MAAPKNVSFSISGADAFKKQLQLLSEMFPEEAGKALRQEAEIEMTEAKRRTPVKTGALRSSGVVEGPDKKAKDVAVRLAFGGPAAAYAIFVHENLEVFHRVGQAKFLESTINESIPYLAERIAKRMASNEQWRDVLRFKKGNRFDDDEGGTGAGPLGGRGGLL